MSINTDNENLLRAVPNMLPYTLPPLVINGNFANLYLRQLLGIFPIAANVGQAEESFASVADPNLTSVADPNIDTIDEDNLTTVDEDNLDTVANNDFDTISRRE